MILVWLAVGVVTGVLLGQVVTIPSGPGELISIAFLASAAAVECGAVLGRRRASALAKFLLVAAFLIFGLARSPHGSVPDRHDVAFYNGATVQLLGRVDAEPDIRDSGANYVIAVQDLVRGGKQIPLSGRVQVHTTRAIQLDYGDGVSLSGRLVTPKNSVKLPWADILARQGISSQMDFPRLLNLGPEPSGLFGWLSRLRQFLENGINAWLPEPEAALLIAITLGAKSASLGDLAPVLVSTGLIHLIAISGIKVALVAGIAHQLAKRFANRLFALVLSLAALWFYVLLTGATVSGARSAIMWTLVFLAAYLGRGTVALVSVAFTAAVMVLIDPGLLWDTSFQLSIFGTFYIVALSEPIEALLMRLPSPFGPVALPTPFREALAVSAAAQLGTLPIVIAGFHVVSAQSPLANMLALPLLPLLIVLGFLVGALSSLPAIVAPIAGIAYGITHDVVLIANDLSGLGPQGLSSSPIFAVRYYVALTALALTWLKRAKWFPRGRVPHLRRELAFASFVGLASVSFSLGGASSDSPPHLYWLGAGNSFLLQSGGQAALVDGSPRPFALLERLGALIPFSERTIDLIILTDPRSSNATALEELVKHYRVGEVLDVGAEYPTATYSRWRADLRSLGVPTYAVRTGISVRVGQAIVSALGPDALYSNPADCVGMLKVTVSGRKWLFVGKSSLREQTEAIFRPVNLRSNFLVTLGKRPASDFLRAVAAAKIYGPWNLPASKPVDLAKT